jgi:hypothetical protein
VFAVTLLVAGVGPVATPAPVSLALQVTVTLVLAQPAALGVEERVAVTVGPVLSRTKVALAGFCDWPVQLLALKFGEALAVTVFTPSPVPATRENVHDDLAVVDVWRVVKAPVSSTHLVSDDVVTVSVSAPPFLAYSVPATRTVPAPPSSDADVTDDADAALGWTRVTINARRVASATDSFGCLRDARWTTVPPSFDLGYDDGSDPDNGRP